MPAPIVKKSRKQADRTAKLSAVLDEQAQAAPSASGDFASPEPPPGWVNPYPAHHPRSLAFYYQLRWMNDRSRFKCGCMTRRGGKDFSSQGEAAEQCFQHPKNQWVTAAPSERQALDSLEQGKTWAEAYDLAIHDYQERRESSHPEALIKSAEIIFSNGSRMRAVPGRPDTVRGRGASLILTEFAFFEDPDKTWRALYPSISNPLGGGAKCVRIISTPAAIGDRFHKIITGGANGKAMQWSVHRVTIHDAVRQGLPVNIDELREGMDDPEGFAVEFECEFADSQGVLLPYELQALAESDEASEAWNWFDLGLQRRGPIFCGIDFGRSKDPTVCWTLEQVGSLLITREVLVLRNMDTQEQMDILSTRLQFAHRCCFDYTGPGVGLGDLMALKFLPWDPEAHSFGKVELFTFTTGSKRELFPRLRQAFAAPTRLRIPKSRVIREDLHEMNQVVTNGEYNYWSRRTKDGHSDRCTALALAVRAAGQGSSTFSFAKIDPVTADMRHGMLVGEQRLGRVRGILV